LNTTKTALLSIVILLVSACKAPLAIWGEGDITSLTGTRNCSLEEFQAASTTCSENEVSAAYVETYTGVARSGWQFRRWANHCGKAQTNECRFNIPAEVIQNFTGITAPTLTAVFRPTTNDGFNSLFIGQSYMAPIVSALEAHANTAGFANHSTTTFFADGADAAPLALWQDLVQRATIQAELDAGTIELFGMAYDSTYPTILGYRKWVNYALKQNPDTRFFIATPLPLDPSSTTSSEYATADQNAELSVNGLIDALRAKFPGVDFYTVPYGRSAVELYNLYDASNLPDVSSLVGATANSVFQDDLGNPGDILASLGQLVWLRSIYALDLAQYSFDPGYIADLKTLAQTIVDGQDAEYHAPPEVDTDTDGDGIVDRLDPNPTGKPNILILMADDLGFNDLAINNGNTVINTPNMDQIATEGVRFTRHYASSVCSPARASFLTGQYPERVGYLPNGMGMSPEIVTLPERLQQEGYTTWHIGKWHIGDLERTAWPDYQGFDHWFGFLNQWRLEGLHVDGEFTLSTPTYNDPWLDSDTAPGQNYAGHLENILTDKAIDVLSDLHAAQAPWFLNLWFYAPHGPIEPASEFATLYPDTNAGKNQALIHQLDFNIGRVISHLETLGVLQDTIVVVISDNGGTNKNIDNNAPYTGAKATTTEGGLRTPLIIRWTDAALNEQVFSDTIGIEDIYPTLMAAIDVVTPSGQDGDSFYDAIAQLEPALQKDRFWELNSNSYGVLSADGLWRLYQRYPVFGFQFEPRVFDLTFDPTATVWELPAPPLQLMQLTDSYKAWYGDVHTVRTHYEPDGNSGGILTGMDFLRTPGFGSYTFGIGVPDELDGQIAAQTGLWQLSRSGDTVMAQYGDVVLTGDITNSNSCHSVVVSGSFSRQTASTVGPDTIDLTLYVDGVPMQTSVIESTLIVPDPTVDTIIGDPGNPAQLGTLAAPIILNSALDWTYSVWTPASFGLELCPGP
jgi:arylsulfatase A-like enzyme